MNDVSSSFNLLGKLPDLGTVGKLDPEIAGEGQRVIYSDGEAVSWEMPAPKANVPDWSKIKSIAHYFNRRGFAVWPAWVYHPSEEPRILKNQDEARILGIWYRKATAEERARYGRDEVWDWEDGNLWRPTPYPRDAKGNPMHQHGKNVVSMIDRSAEQNTLVASVVAAVTAQIGKSGPAAPASVDPSRWKRFIEFEAWQKAQEAVGRASEEAEASEILSESVTDEEADEANMLTPEQERTVWTAEAERRGVKVDKRWSLDRLKAEVEKAAA